MTETSEPKGPARTDNDGGEEIESAGRGVDTVAKRDPAVISWDAVFPAPLLNLQCHSKIIHSLGMLMC